MGAGDLPLPVDADRSRLKREECKRTKHDDVFSRWKVLIGPSDWEDYLVGKEGAARYRVHNLPATACPGVYELGIVVSRTGLGREAGKLDPGNIVVVYLGQADNVRTRLQRYGRSGAHLGYGNPMSWANDCKTVSLQKGPGVFEEVFSRGHSIVFRWAPMKSKADALRTEAQLLETFDYAWNKGCNGDRRPDDILGKLEKVASRAAQFSTMVRKLLPFSQKRVGIKIEATKLLSSGKICNSDANDETYPFFFEVFRISRSRPRLVLDRPAADDRNTKICGMAFRDGSVCTRPPVEGRKRCPEHKGKKISSSGMKLNTEMRSQAESEFDSQGKQFFGFEPTKLPSVVDLPVSDVFTPTCGFSPEDGSPCQRPPVKGRKRCHEHKGKRVYESNNKKMPERTSHCSGLYSGTSSEMQTLVSSGKNAVLKGYDTTCGVALGDGSSCTRPPVKGRKRCEEHKGLRINGIISKLVSKYRII